MTAALACYSAVFMRYAVAVQPKNYLLFGCHIINFSSQITQGYRYLNYWKYVTFLPPEHTELLWHGRGLFLDSVMSAVTSVWYEHG